MAITKSTRNAKTIVGVDEPLIADVARGDVVLSTNKGVLTKNIAGDGLEVIADRTSITRNSVSVVYPKDAMFDIHSSVNMGVLSIIFPSASILTMSSATIDAFIYTNGGSFSLIVSGYQYSSPKWHSITAKAITTVPAGFDVVRFVRFLKVGGDPAVPADFNRFGIIMGALDDSLNWKYPKVAVTKVIAGYSNYNIEKLETGWELDIGLVADLPQYVLDYTRTV